MSSLWRNEIEVTGERAVCKECDQFVDVASIVLVPLLVAVVVR